MTELTDEQVKQVADLSKYLNQAQIADYLNIPLRTFEAILARDEKVSAAYKRGKTEQINKVAQSLFSNATENNNVTAQIFYLKTQAGWKEDQPDTQDVDPIVINPPA